MDAGVAALRRVQANLKAACEGRLDPTEAGFKRTADNADHTDNKLRKSASSAQSAVKIPGFETDEQLLARILADRRLLILHQAMTGEFLTADGADITDGER